MDVFYSIVLKLNFILYNVNLYYFEAVLRRDAVFQTLQPE